MRVALCVMMALFCLGLTAQDTGRLAVLIHEILPDPDPSSGLPRSEFIELRNNSARSIDLRNWSISNGTTTGKITGNYLLQPDSLVILTTSSALAAYRSFGAAIALTPFPTLGNLGDTLILLSPQGKVVHAITWDKELYGNDMKAEGGWSLEMKDAGKPCTGRVNWSASTAGIGGTPGRKNSITTLMTDTTPPFVTTALMKDSVTIIVHLSEPLGLQSQVGLQGATIKTMLAQPPFYNKLEIQLTAPYAAVKMILRGIKDCSGNSMQDTTLELSILQTAAEKDILVNEILFDPPPGGTDYLEIFNSSGKMIDMRTIFVANRNSTGRISGMVRLNADNHNFMPGQFAVLCADTSWLRKKFPVPPGTAFQLQLPSMPDDEGSVLLLSENGSIIDELRYNDKWHHPLVADPQGVALERLSALLPSQEALNWHSASSSSGYGTPGAVNSQYTALKDGDKSSRLSSRIISPDMDGRDDLVIATYHLGEPGYSGSITISDLRGLVVRTLARNLLCGTTNHIKWDGFGEGGSRLPTGHYIILAGFIHPSGKTRMFKDVIAVRNLH